MQNKNTSEYSEIFPYAISPFRLLRSDPIFSQWPTTTSLSLFLFYFLVCQDLSIFHFDLSHSLPFDEVIVYRIVWCHKVYHSSRLHLLYIYIYIYKFVGHNLQFLMFNYFMSFFFRKYFMSYLNLIKVVSTFHFNCLFIWKWFKIISTFFSFSNLMKEIIHNSCISFHC